MRAGRERLAGDVEHHDGVLAAREQEAGALHLGGDLAEDVDALGLEGTQLAQRVRLHAGAPGASSDPRLRQQAAQVGDERGVADQEVGRPGVRPVVDERRSVEAGRVQAGRVRHGHRRGRVPLVLATGVDVGVDASVDHGHHLDPGRAHRDELARRRGPRDARRRRGSGSGHRDPERPGAGEDVAGRVVRDRVDRRAVVGEAPGREGHRAGAEAAPRLPQRHVDREVGAPGPVRVHLGELAGAVERVDDPDAPRGQARRVALGLLGQHGIVRPVLREGGCEPGLGGKIPGPAQVIAVTGRIPGIRPGTQGQQDLSGPRGQGGGQARVIGSCRLPGRGDRPSARSSPRPACRHPPPAASSFHAPRDPLDLGRRERSYHPRMVFTFRVSQRILARR